MHDAIYKIRWARGARTVVALGLLLAAAGCELSKQQQPDLTGPADQGFNIELEALPDTLNADGVSTSRLRAVVRNQSGAPITGYAVLFQHDGDGVLRPASGSTYVGPIQTGEVMATDNNGTAFMVYTAGFDLRTVTVAVRPYNFDAGSFYFRAVFIYQR
jgi:Invasin, domain 3